jgi:protein TonB
MFARVQVPRAGRTPSIRERLRQVREQLLKEHLQQLAKIAKSRPEPDTDDDGDDDGKEAPAAAGDEPSTGGGPVAANTNSNGRGYGVGHGTGSAGILQDPEFLLYYQKVQERIKDAWSFASGNKELTTTVSFGIGRDGRLTGIEVARSSNNNSFDESVKRAIRRAAPFPPPPAKYRDQFGQGVQAVFRLGDLRS